ncbi:putative Peptidylprolyl isomerase [Cryptosporidium felis]|nr:putative Peptidylprolyl isomerase [Cryptosporidium felis]
MMEDETSDSGTNNFTDINSDEELPCDSIGDFSVVSVKGILREIIKCGEGYEKPGVGDEIQIEITKEDSKGESKILKVILGDWHYGEIDSTRNKKVPWGVEMAIRKMLKGEQSRIHIKKGSIFSNPRESGRSSTTSIIPVEDYRNFNSRSKKLLNLVRKDSGEFETFLVTLDSFCRLEALSNGIYKKIWRKGINMRSPGKRDVAEIRISFLTVEKSLSHFAEIPMNFNPDSLNWLMTSLVLSNPHLEGELEEGLRLIGISAKELSKIVHSLRVGEISEFRLPSADSKRGSAILIHLTGFFWEKTVKMKLPINGEVENQTVQLCSFDSEKSNISTKRISSLSLNHNTRLEIQLHKFTLVDDNRNLRIGLNLPINSSEISDSARLSITPGFYSLPIWLEQTIGHCYLGGKFKLQIPSPLIFLFPPKEIVQNQVTEIQKKTCPILIAQGYNNSPTRPFNDFLINKNPCNKQQTFWDIELLMKDLIGLGYSLGREGEHKKDVAEGFENESDEFEKKTELLLGLKFELELEICTTKVAENYVPSNFSNLRKEFEFYHFLIKLFGHHFDYFFKKKWSVLALEIFDKFLFVSTLLPFYSKLVNNPKEIHLINEEDNIKEENKLVRSLTSKYCSLFLDQKKNDPENCSSLNIDDAEINSILGTFGFEEKSDLETFVDSVTTIIQIYEEINKLDNFSHVLGKYVFFSELKSEIENLTLPTSKT